MKSKNPCLTVTQLIKELEKMPRNARVRFLDTDDPERAACDVESAGTFRAVADGIGDEGDRVLREAGLEPGQVIIQGVTR